MLRINELIISFRSWNKVLNWEQCTRPISIGNISDCCNSPIQNFDLVYSFFQVNTFGCTILMIFSESGVKSEVMVLVAIDFYPSNKICIIWFSQQEDAVADLYILGEGEIEANWHIWKLLPETVVVERVYVGDINQFFHSAETARGSVKSDRVDVDWLYGVCFRVVKTAIEAQDHQQWG